MPPPDFFRRAEEDVPLLRTNDVVALLNSDLVRPRSSTRDSVFVDASVLERLGSVAVVPAPVDSVSVSVSRPVAQDTAAEFLAGVLFRRASHVVPSAADDGIAIFGEERAEDHLLVHEPPIAGARAEVTFVPPRPDARYLLEFACSGTSVGVRGSDGTSLVSEGAFSVVLFSSPRTVTYVLESSRYWWFRRCSIRWLAD